jgi:hypothetical protein
MSAARRGCAIADDEAPPDALEADQRPHDGVLVDAQLQATLMAARR